MKMSELNRTSADCTLKRPEDLKPNFGGQDYGCGVGANMGYDVGGGVFYDGGGLPLLWQGFVGQTHQGNRGCLQYFAGAGISDYIGGAAASGCDGQGPDAGPHAYIQGLRTS
jgi:hypothetical protein